MKGITYFRWWGFSINEGAGPINIHASYIQKQFLFYLYFFGKRFTMRLPK